MPSLFDLLLSTLFSVSQDWMNQAQEALSISNPVDVLLRKGIWPCTQVHASPWRRAFCPLWESKGILVPCPSARLFDLHYSWSFSTYCVRFRVFDVFYCCERLCLASSFPCCCWVISKRRKEEMIIYSPDFSCNYDKKWFGVMLY